MKVPLFIGGKDSGCLSSIEKKQYTSNNSNGLQCIIISGILCYNPT